MTYYFINSKYIDMIIPLDKEKLETDRELFNLLISAKDQMNKAL